MMEEKQLQSKTIHIRRKDVDVDVDVYVDIGYGCGYIYRITTTKMKGIIYNSVDLNTNFTGTGE